MAGWIFCISFYVISSLLLSEGIGLFDATILTFPILMICAAFLFDTRGLLVATMASILTVFTVYAFQVRGLFQSIDWVSLLRTVVVCLLFAVTAIVIWIVRTTWAKTITLLNESYDLTLRGWARALELRDGETAGHSQRVTQLSVAIAEALGLEMEDVTNIRRGAYLHDIGKMAIPDPILLKPGPLTKEEWEVMKQHPMRAREFLLEIPFLRGVIPIVYSHHERWDGTGYPEGLQGEKIPLLARIFAVVDNWDALTSDRPYRKAWSEEKAAAFLKENSGKVFDPGVVNVFLSVILKKN
jgi:putative nucleotidyltransferase with HDIG domain